MWVSREVHVWGLLCVLFGLCAPPLRAQFITGRILETGTRRPVILAEVALVDSSGAVHDRTVSNHNGFYRLDVPEPGAYLIAAERIGYQSVVDGVVEIGEGGRLSIDFFLPPEPVVIDPITATVEKERVERRLETQGFYRRMSAGFGNFVTPEELEETTVPGLVELLDRMPGVHRRGTSQGSGLFFRRTNSITDSDPPGLCTPSVYVDGIRQEAAGFAPGARLDQFLNLDDIAGVEVYTRVSAAPIQYSVPNTTFDGVKACGVILIWTK